MPKIKINVQNITSPASYFSLSLINNITDKYIIVAIAKITNTVAIVVTKFRKISQIILISFNPFKGKF
jgi:hypothetical protein